MMDAVILQKEALLLPERERALLADSLLESLSRPPAKQEAAWIKEADSRLAAFRQGQIEAIDGGVAMADLRSRFGR